MPVSNYQEQTLDSDTRQTLENSLAMQVIKLFAIIARADKVISDQELDFVTSFLNNLYPSNISQYLFSRFEEYISRDLDLERVAETINSILSYQEKIFCLIKTYELIESDEAVDVEINTAHKLCDLLNIKYSDIAFIENSFGLTEVPQSTLDESTIIPLRVTGDALTADVYLPYPGLDLVIYKIVNIYCIIKKDDICNVVVSDFILTKNLLKRIPHNSTIIVNDYTIKYNDLRIYFENKIQPLQKDLFFYRQNGEITYNHYQTPDSILRITYSSSLITLALLNKEVEIILNGIKVTDKMYVNFNDYILMDRNIINLREIFSYIVAEIEIPLNKSQSCYEITNNVNGDIFISDDISEKWAVKIKRGKNRFMFNAEDCPYQVFLNNKPVTGERRISNGDTVYINNHFLNFDFENFIVKNWVLNFKKLVVDSLYYAFDDGSAALDGISFDINLGDLACIIGPSGCGKSTLLNIMSGLSRATRGNIFLDEHNLCQNYHVIKDYLGYVPQDDLLVANLTVYENLYYYAKLRFPHKSKAELNAQINLVLKDIGLLEKKDTIVGEATHKTLSGGERKRLNIGLELLTNAEVYFLDEPTSGLSSTDSEKILNLLSNIASRDKIVLVVIHQPSSRLYKMFNKVILLDKGGRLAYQGDIFSALRYFKEHMDISSFGIGNEVECPYCKMVRPGLMLDSMEESLRDIDGTILRERKYSPVYWKMKYHSYIDKIQGLNLKHHLLSPLPPPRNISFIERLKQFFTLLSRNFKNKMRDRSNLLITFIEAPLLGGAVGFILRYAPFDEYTLYTNEVFRIFLFVSVIVSIFLGLTNSMDEIIDDAALFMRERMLNLQRRTYLASKILVLLPFAVVQNALFVVMGFLFLEVRELYVHYVIFLSIVSLAGISIGLLVSSIPNISSRAAQNIIPLILIPQIILGGALIQYEKMNVQMYVYEKSPIPEVCHILPSRWAFEGLMVMQESFNRFDPGRTRFLEAIEDLKSNRKDIISRYGEDHYTEKLDRLESEREAHYKKYKDKYGNVDIHDAIVFADHDFRESMSESDSTGVSQAGFIEFFHIKYPFFVKHKTLPFINKEVNTVFYNALVILFISVVLNMITLFILRFRENIKLCMDKIGHGFGVCFTRILSKKRDSAAVKT